MSGHSTPNGGGQKSVSLTLETNRNKDSETKTASPRGTPRDTRVRGHAPPTATVGRVGTPGTTGVRRVGPPRPLISVVCPHWV